MKVRYRLFISMIILYNTRATKKHFQSLIVFKFDVGDNFLIELSVFHSKCNKKMTLHAANKY